MDSYAAEGLIPQALARLLDSVGSHAFWRRLILLVELAGKFNNALVTFSEAGTPPEILEEYDAEATSTPSPLPRYVGGLYLLDPFAQAVIDGLKDGCYRLEEVAPDMFRQSDYFLNYFREAVGDDEIQLITAYPPSGTLVLSLGFASKFDRRIFHTLVAWTPWITSAMRLHWRLVRQVAGTHEPSKIGRNVNPLPDTAEQVEQALVTFGSDVLTERELTVARLILRGHSSKAICVRLGISVDTVKVHRRNMYAKLGVSSQSELFSLFLVTLIGAKEAGDD